MARMKRTEKTPDPVKQIRFESVSAAMAATVAPLTMPENISIKSNAISDYKGRDWYGVENPAQVNDAMRNGYPKGLRMIDDCRAQITGTIPKAIGVNRSRKRGAMGDELDIHAVNRGAVDRAWSTQSRAIKRTANFIRIAIDIGANSGTSAERLAWRGVAGMVLSDVLTKAGYSVEIIAAFGISGYALEKQSRMLFSTVVKPSRALADRGLLASVLTMPGFFRVYGFDAIIRAADADGMECTSNLGQSASVESLLPPDDRAIQIIVPQSVVNESSALEWVRQNIQLLQMATIQREGR